MNKKSLTAMTVAVLGLVWSPAWAAFDHEHTELTKALAKNVVYKDGGSEVNYGSLQKNPSDLIRYLKAIGKVTEKAFKEFTPDEQKAFLINSYNAFTLQLVKDNFPVPSIKKIQGPGGPWKMKFIRLLGRDHNLDDLKQMLRRDHTDTRVFFALTSASVGSPRLRNEAYVATRLNEQLEDQMKVFLRDNAMNRLDTTRKVAQLSDVFNDIKEDFNKSGTTVTKFIAPYMSDDIKVRAELEGGTYAVEYLDPNWNLNKLSK
jgi:hypothetical protein